VGRTYCCAQDLSRRQGMKGIGDDSGLRYTRFPSVLYVGTRDEEAGSSRRLAAIIESLLYSHKMLLNF
jgi:hypothetical protein